MGVCLYISQGGKLTWASCEAFCSAPRLFFLLIESFNLVLFVFGITSHLTFHLLQPLSKMTVAKVFVSFLQDSCWGHKRISHHSAGYRRSSRCMIMFSGDKFYASAAVHVDILSFHLVTALADTFKRVVSSYSSFIFLISLRLQCVLIKMICFFCGTMAAFW